MTSRHFKNLFTSLIFENSFALELINFLILLVRSPKLSYVLTEVYYLIPNIVKIGHLYSSIVFDMKTFFYLIYCLFF